MSTATATPSSARVAAAVGTAATLGAARDLAVASTVDPDQQSRLWRLAQEIEQVMANGGEGCPDRDRPTPAR